MNQYKDNLLQQNNFISYIRDQRKYSEHTIRGYSTDLHQLIEYLGEDKRIIDLMNSTTKTVDSLMKIDMPAGVDIEIKT